VLGSYNRLRFLKLTIESIRRELDHCSFPHEIIVVDGGSTDGTLSWLAKQKDIILIIQHNRGEWRGKTIARRSWGYFMNLGFKCAQGKYVCMLSDDCLVVPGAIANGVELFEQELSKHEKVGAIAFYWRNWPEQEKYWVGQTFGNKIFVNHGIYLKKALEEVCYIDEDRYSFYHADGDLCLKMWQLGYSCIESPASFVEHFSHANQTVRGTNLVNQSRDWENYRERWEGVYGIVDKDWLEKSYADMTQTAARFKVKVWKIPLRSRQKYVLLKFQLPFSFTYSVNKD
jgi:glycosyltransferase involved in cell wall biosynthesis